ncbi:hypothetical protein BKA70DRAFT_90687 [Coprinopsis sp. MPI-PUGE-AT-0042]|nr:hypothetical protein BKA70DRAFT_90687 [Coprinopsis sp. MPI-PUGE-AT-0042]
MKLTSATVLCAFALSCSAALTKGTLQMKTLTSQKTLTLTTEFDSFDGRIFVPEASSEPKLQVQLDIEKAQTTEVDIEILNGFWTDLYPYLGITNNAYDLNWNPPYAPLAKVMNVQKTQNATMVPKENAFTACNPNGMPGLPPQASAIWKYDPVDRRILPTFLAPNGTRLPAQLQGNLYEEGLYFNLWGHGRPPSGSSEVLELYFTPTAA